MKNNTWLLLALAGVAYWLYRSRAGSAPKTVSVPLKTKAPPGSQATGRIQRTINNRPPGYPDETIAYAPREWAQMQTPDGELQWHEVG